MAKTNVKSGMWRVDPRRWSRVIDRCGQPVASVESEAGANANASLIAAAPDMFELLERLESNGALPENLLEEMRLVLRRARGDFGLAVFSRLNKYRGSNTSEWLKFMERLWKPNLDAEE